MGWEIADNKQQKHFKSLIMTYDAWRRKQKRQQQKKEKKELWISGISQRFFGKTFTVFNLLLSVVFQLKIAPKHEGKINNLEHAVTIAKFFRWKPNNWKRKSSFHFYFCTDHFTLLLHVKMTKPSSQICVFWSCSLIQKMQFMLAAIFSRFTHEVYEISI